jgi:hypothetical protein
MPAKPKTKTKAKAKPTPKTAKNPKGAGRKPVPIDYEAIRGLCQMQATEEEMAAWVGLTPEGFRQRKIREPAIQEVIDEERGKGKVSLRRSQWKLAQAGNPTMNIWLGKQWLGQRDKQDIDQTNTVNVTIIKPGAKQKK